MIKHEKGLRALRETDKGENKGRLGKKLSLAYTENSPQHKLEHIG